MWVGKSEGDRQLGKSKRRWKDKKWTFKKYDGELKWINLAWDRNKWRVLVNVVVTLWVPKMGRIS